MPTRVSCCFWSRVKSSKGGTQTQHYPGTVGTFAGICRYCLLHAGRIPARDSRTGDAVFSQVFVDNVLIGRRLAATADFGDRSHSRAEWLLLTVTVPAPHEN